MSETLPDRVRRYIDRHGLLRSGQRVLVGVSGGPDSMVCLAVLRKLDYDVSAVHVNYGLRAGADADEALVRDYCTRRSIPLRVESLDATRRAEARGTSLQAAARDLRYAAFTDVAADADIPTVAVGHHRDDQAETLLLNLFRGAGPEGLAGMPPARPLQEAPDVRLVRPLLDEPRTAIEDYAAAHDIPWRHDPSNEDSSFDRAVLRTDLLPRIEERFPGASDNLARAATLMREYVDATLAPALADRMERCVRRTPQGGWVDLASLRDEPAVWRRRVLLEALSRTLPDAPQTHAVADQLAALIHAQPGARMDVDGGTVWRERGGLRFVPQVDAAAPVPPTPVPWGEDVPVATGTLRVDPLDRVPDTVQTESSWEAYADRDRLSEPLTLRSWRAGDRLQPLGMEGTKKVSDLLTDAKVPPHRRDAVCVLATDEHLAWVVGHRLDHRVRIRPDTTRAARLTWQPQQNPNRENASDDCISA
ncbi:MAG: tRNA lysidine(34) synthetase TilS [Salinivenus sp.]